MNGTKSALKNPVDGSLGDKNETVHQSAKRKVSVYLTLFQVFKNAIVIHAVI
jgi:hypothetical protein